MSKAKSDLRRVACEYRDRLASELVKVDEFIEMAGRLSDPKESSGSGLMLFTGTAASAAMN